MLQTQDVSANAQAPSDRRMHICVASTKPRDALLTCAHLREVGLEAFAVTSFDDLLVTLRQPVGALMLTEDAVPPARWEELAEVFAAQPAWSDLPVIVFSRIRQPGLEALLRTGLGNITVVETPVRVSTVVSAAQTAMRARRRQYEVRDLLNRLEEADRRKDEFLAMLGHELRNPLAAIQLALQVRQMQNPMLPPDRGTEVMQRQLRNLGRIVDDLLDVSRVTLGKIQLECTDVDLGDAARRCAQALSHEASVSKLKLRVHGPSRPLFVRADAVRLEQVLANLVTNAIKYTPAGGTIDIKIAPVGDHVRVTIRDTGIGIEPEIVPSLFDLFTQAKQGLDRSRGGLGLGLALVKQLVELHQGRIGASSEGLGKGSTFWFELALITPAATTTAPTAAQHNPLRILVVEDNEDARDLLENLLSDAGHDVQTAPDGLAGLRAALDGQPDVLLLDIGLPHLNGYQVAQEVRRSPTRQPHMIAMTGYGQPADRERALAAGFDLFVVKPIDLADLQLALARCAEQQLPAKIA